MINGHNKVADNYKPAQNQYCPSLSHDQLVARVQRFYEHLTEYDEDEDVSIRAIADRYAILFEEIICDEF